MTRLHQVALRDLFPLRSQRSDAPPCPVCGEQTLYAGHSSGAIVYQTEDTTCMSCEQNFYRCDGCNVTVAACLTHHEVEELAPP